MSVDLAAVVAAVEASLGAGRLEGVDPDEPLLHGGIITSIELVTLVVDLEQHFDVEIADADLAPDTTTLARLVLLLGGKAGALDRGDASWGLARFLTRPAAVVLSALLFFLVIDRGVGWAVDRGPLADRYQEFLEQGERLYPHAGNFAQDDFAFAVSQHRISRHTRPPGRSTALFFGDSGTIGSFFPARFSIPSAADAKLEDVDVMNLAFFGRLLVKDFMLLEAVWDHEFEVAIFTVGDDFFSLDRVDNWVRRYRHCSFNWPLFERFIERLPLSERAPFASALADLVKADASHDGPRRRLGFRWLALPRYRPFLQYLLREEVLQDPFYSYMRSEAPRTQARRRLLRRRPRAVAPGLPQAEVAENAVQMLESTIRLLERRGVRSVLFVEPFSPGDWPRGSKPGTRSGADIAHELSGRTEAVVVDLTWELDAREFLDPAHYVPIANARLGHAVARAVQPLVTPP